MSVSRWRWWRGSRCIWRRWRRWTDGSNFDYIKVLSTKIVSLSDVGSSKGHPGSDSDLSSICKERINAKKLNDFSDFVFNK